MMMIIALLSRKIGSLWDARQGSDDAIKLDLLVIMVERYEEKRWPIRKPKWDPIDVLHYAIDEMGHTQMELAEILGSSSRASEILSLNARSRLR
jgi:HTH-type transcriptional regulator/antitoxin HigA